MEEQPSLKDLRVFASIWMAIFLIIALLPLFSGEALRFWAFAIALLMGGMGALKPNGLVGLYRRWVRVGEMIGGVVSKVILFILFFGMFVPIGLVFKLLRKDPLKRTLSKEAKSYWIKREHQPGSMKFQF